MATKLDQLLTVPEAAQALRMTCAGIRRWLLERRIGYVHCGRLVRIPLSEIERILREGFCPSRPRRAQ
jgi:excisionase family DNA binding protein